MKRNFVVSLFGSFIGFGMLLIVLGTAGIAGARSVDARPDTSQVTAVSVSTPLTSTFTYQGQLKNAGSPITDTCDFQFGLWDSLSGSTQIGITQTLSAPVNAGYFTALLNTGNPFGINAFNGNMRWLAIAVRCPAGGGSYTGLSPRQQLTAAPYALFSAAPWVTSGSNLTYNAGNVGIGTTTPAHHLSISGGPLWTSNNWLGALEFSNGSALGWQANSSGQRFGLGHSNGGLAFFRTASNPGTTASPATYDMFINDGGNVGIGTTNPLATLDVNGGIQGTGLTAPANLFLNASTGRIALRTTDGGPYAERMTILANGNIGIGTTSPGAKLDVVGPDINGSTSAFRVSAGNVPGLEVFKDGFVGANAFSSGSQTNVCWASTPNSGLWLLATCGFAAQYVPTIDVGQGFPETADLVSTAPSVKNPYGDTQGPFAVSKSMMACDTNLLGFIVNPESGADGKKLNDHYLPLAIYGYFPAKVTMENGAIKRGDALTSSSKAGYAMKATQACKIIGYALEDADHDGTIQVFANHGENAAPEVAALRTQVQELKDQNASLDARLTALEQTMSGQTQTPSTPSGNVVLLGALFAIVGIVVGRRVNTGDRL